MTNDSNTILGKSADWLLSCLTQCHNVLRSQERMTSEGAFRELNRLLFVKYYCENTGVDYWRYDEDSLRQLFYHTIKQYYEEHLFDYSETITSSSNSYRDVFGLLLGFNFSMASPELGEAYETFAQRILRGISDEPIIPSLLAEQILDFLSIRFSNTVIDPNCGYGVFLTSLRYQGPYNNYISNHTGYEGNILLAQTAKINLLMHGDRITRIESGLLYKYHHPYQFDFVVTSLKKRESIWDDIKATINLLNPEGQGAILIPNDILQQDYYSLLRRDLLQSCFVMAIIALPSSAVKIEGKQVKCSVLYVKKGGRINNNKETLIAKVENFGMSSLGLYTANNDFKGIESVFYQWMQLGTKQKNSHVRWVNLEESDSWDVESVFRKEENLIVSQYPFLRLGDLVTISNIPLVDKLGDELKQVTVRRNQHDVILRAPISVKEIKHPERHSIVRSGQILVSRINAKEGAIGIVPNELDGATASANYIVLSVNPRIIDSYFLLMVLTSERYKKVLNGISRGVTSLTYISIVDLLELEIPVPDLGKQREMIRGVAGIQQQINQLEKDKKERENRFSIDLFGL